MDLYSKIRSVIRKDGDLSACNDLYLLCRENIQDEHAREFLLWLSQYCEEEIVKRSGERVEKMFYLHENVLLTAAPYDFESYLLFTEWNREYNKQFYRPRRKQLKFVCQALQDLEDKKIDKLAISMPPGVGKALANDTPVLTRNGWKNHGDLVVGDEVIGLNGEFKRVIAVHPKCMLDRLVEFSDGETIQCHEKHEWVIHDRASTNSGLKQVETNYIENRSLDQGVPGKRGHRYNIQLPHKKWVMGEEKELPLDPYTFGVWLGDGTNKNPTICCDKKDVCVIERISRNGFASRWNTTHKDTGVLYFGFDIRKELQSMGMCHSRRATPKHIPDVYLTASLNQRLELLAGLLDTDGCLVGKKYQFTTAEEELKDSVISLLSTFGWRVCVTKREPKISSSGIVGRKPYYILSFTPDMMIPCEVKRKRNLKISEQRAIAFKSIRKVEPKEGNCITVEGDGVYLVGKTLIPTHNSTIALFYLTWLAGKYPDLGCLTVSHKAEFVQGCYEECLGMTSPVGEYRWAEVFPDVGLTKTDAKALRIDFNKRNPRRETLQFTTVGSGNAGLYRATKLLYCDDLVSGSEVALNKEQLDKLWNAYSTDFQQRIIGDICGELHIATRWSVFDVIGRLYQIYGGSDRARFITMPAWDKDEQSLWDYKDAPGYTTERLHQLHDTMSPEDWNALYMNKPVEREGLLYPVDELRRFYELPKHNDGTLKEPDYIIAVCDTKDTGKDYAFLPVAYVYGEDYYIEDCICDNGLPRIVDVRLAQILLRHKVNGCRFESNSAGGKTAEKVQEIIRENHGITHITTKYTTANKITKIIQNSDWVQRHCLFKTEDCYKPNSDYGRMMNFLSIFTVSGKNPHDDVPDGLAQLAQYAQSYGTNVTVIARPW